ncbi:MAG: RodZ domain-containing protein, partial [Rubrivivax sp.]
KKLEALEADRWTELPDATFTRALAQTVCRTLKIDPRMVLDKLPALGGVSLSVPTPEEAEAASSPMRSRGVTRSSRGPSGGLSPMVWGAVLLLLAAVALFFLPSSWWSGSTVALGPAVQSTAASAASAAAAPAAEPASSPVAMSLAASQAVPAVAPAAASAAAVTPVGVSLAASASVLSSLPAPEAQSAGTLQLAATSDSWVEIRDARGELLASRLLRSGERLGLDGAVPLRATIGNVAGTQVSWRGRSVDLQAHAQGNVARLELP